MQSRALSSCIESRPVLTKVGAFPPTAALGDAGGSAGDPVLTPSTADIGRGSTVVGGVNEQIQGLEVTAFWMS